MATITAFVYSLVRVMEEGPTQLPVITENCYYTYIFQHVLSIPFHLLRDYPSMSCAKHGDMIAFLRQTYRCFPTAVVLQIITYKPLFVCVFLLKMPLPGRGGL